jgi:hypothetical protein
MRIARRRTTSARRSPASRTGSRASSRPVLCWSTSTTTPEVANSPTPLYEVTFTRRDGAYVISAAGANIDVEVALAAVIGSVIRGHNCLKELWIIISGLAAQNFPFSTTFLYRNAVRDPR